MFSHILFSNGGISFTYFGFQVPPMYSQEESGLYSEVNLTHHMISKAALPLVLEAVDSIPVKTGSVFTIVDYGTADGGTSMLLIYACVKALREKYGEELSINVIYEDQPENDFKSLFRRVHGEQRNNIINRKDMLKGIFTHLSYFQACFLAHQLFSKISKTCL